MATIYFGNTLIDKAVAPIVTSVVSCTKLEYEALAFKDPNTLYVLTDVEDQEVQPDWNQNDESAPDYVKNRTHWVEPSVGFVLANDTYFHGETYTITVDSSGYSDSVDVEAGVIDEDGERHGGRFRVTWNGVEYEVNHGSRNENMMPELGYDRYDLPFKISALSGVTRIYLNDELGPYSPGTYEATVKIEYLVPDTYHKIPIEFMPSEVATVYAVNNKAPKDHSTSATTYGLGSSAYYGHVKLSDQTNSSSGSFQGVAATPKAVKAAYDLAASKAPMYTYGTDDLTAGSSPLATGQLHFVYE